MKQEKQVINIIHHSADWDGKFSGKIAEEDVALRCGGAAKINVVGWDFGDAPLDPKMTHEAELTMVLDLPLDRTFGIQADEIKTKLDVEKVVWIDHHASSIASHPADIDGWRMEGVAACRLAWQFLAEMGYPAKRELTKKDFVERKVKEPLAVRLVGEHDVWDHRDEHAMLLQYGLNSTDIRYTEWMLMLGVGDDCYTKLLMESGQVVKTYVDKKNAAVVERCGFTMRWEGLTFLVCNAALSNSTLFESAVKPEHDACMAFYFRGATGEWHYSLYGVPHKPEVDLSVLAVKNLGGGHRHACGFNLPFLLPEIAALQGWLRLKEGSVALEGKEHAV